MKTEDSIFLVRKGKNSAVVLEVRNFISKDSGFGGLHREISLKATTVDNLGNSNISEHYIYRKRITELIPNSKFIETKKEYEDREKEIIQLIINGKNIPNRLII